MNFKVTTHMNSNGVFYYILETESGYVFRDKRLTQTDADGNEISEYVTAIGLLPEEYANLDSTVEVLPVTPDMSIH